MALAEQQIKAAFEQSEKEASALHTRISEGIREAKKNGASKEEIEKIKNKVYKPYWWVPIGFCVFSKVWNDRQK